MHSCSIGSVSNLYTTEGMGLTLGQVRRLPKSKISRPSYLPLIAEYVQIWCCLQHSLFIFKQFFIELTKLPELGVGISNQSCLFLNYLLYSHTQRGPHYPWLVSHIPQQLPQQRTWHLRLRRFFKSSRAFSFATSIKGFQIEQALLQPRHGAQM